MTYADTVLADSPIVYYRLAESSGSFSNSGSIGGSASAGTGIGRLQAAPKSIDGYAVSFNNTSSATIQQNVSGSYFNGSYSVELWMKTTKTDSTMFIYWGSPYCYMNTTAAGKINFSARDSTPGIVSPLAYNDGIWHHVVATVSGTTAKLYVDGVQVVTGSTGTGSFSNDRLVVGDDRTSFAFSGHMDEFALYPSTLSAARITDHYDSASGIVIPVGPAKSVKTNAVARMKSMATQPRLTLSSVVAEPKYISIGKQALLKFAAVGGRLESSTKAPKVLSSKQCKLVMFAADKCRIQYGVAVPVETPLGVLSIDAPMERKIDKLSMYGNKLDAVVARKEIQ